MRLKKQPGRMRQQRLSLFCSIIFHPCLVSVYPLKWLWYPYISLVQRTKPTISPTFTASLSFSLLHTIGLLSLGPVWCWTLDSRASSLNLPLSLKFTHFIYLFQSSRGSLIAYPSKLVPSLPFFLIMWACSGPSPPPTQGRPRPV